MNASASIQRPQLLKVLCILSVLGGIFQFGMGAAGAFTGFNQRMAEMQKQQHQQMVEKFGPDHPAVKMNEGQAALNAKTVQYAKPLGLTSVITAAISLLGVWFMWNLKKAGLGLYALAGISAHAVTFWLLGFDDAWSNTTMAAGLIVTIVFIVLYGFNLKHMR